MPRARVVQRGFFLRYPGTRDGPRLGSCRPCAGTAAVFCAPYTRALVHSLQAYQRYKFFCVVRARSAELVRVSMAQRTQAWHQREGSYVYFRAYRSPGNQLRRVLLCVSWTPLPAPPFGLLLMFRFISRGTINRVSQRKILFAFPIPPWGM